MPLPFPQLSEIECQIVRDEVRRRLLADEDFFRGVPFENITISHPHRWYAVHMADAVSGNLLSRATSECWRYILAHGATACGLVTLIEAGGKSGGKPSIGALYQTCLTDETLKALGEAGNLAKVKAQDYDVRLISDLTNAFHAVWLHAKSDEIIIPLPPTYGRVTPYKPYTESELCEIFRQDCSVTRKI